MTARIKWYSVLSLLLITTLSATAQVNPSLKQANDRLHNTQNSFNKLLGGYAMIKNGKAILMRFSTIETDSLQKITNKSTELNESLKIIAINAQSNLFDTLSAEMRRKIFDVNYIRLYIDRFKQIWQSLYTHKSYDEIMRPFGAKASGMMAGVFRDFPQGDRIKDLARLKLLETNPDRITNFLSNNNRYALMDSLIFICANTRPELLINFALNTRDEILSNAVKQHKSPIVQTLLSIAKEKNLKIYIPFVVQLSENQLTLADIEKTRTQPNEFYHLLVDAEIANRAKIRSGEYPLYVEPTRAYLKKFAIKFYTDIINSLHEEPSEKKRYFVLEELRPQDLYFVITSGETELYTSSYLYIYKKLLGMFPKNGSDSLFRLVKFDQYKKFLLMAGRYNTLSSFMKQMPGDSSIKIIKRLMNGLEVNMVNGLEETINVAETFPGIVHDPYLADLTSKEIINNYNRCSAIPNPYGMKVYTLLSDIFKATKDGNDVKAIQELNPALAVYFNVPHNSLYDDDKKINQLVFFYGDEDGKASYGSFMSNFSDASKWSIERNKYWTTIKSKKNFPVSIYANLPLNEETEEDLKSQDTLVNYLADKNIEAHILIHRGHSYHLQNSLKRVTPAVRLAILGSCGGYTEIFELLKKSPDAQVISTKQVGSKTVNEPLLRLINDQLLTEKDINWANIWQRLDTQFKSNKQVYDYFQEYVPPYKNISLLVAALFTQSGIE